MSKNSASAQRGGEKEHGDGEGANASEASPPEDFFAVELSHIGKKSKIELRRGQMLLIEGAA